MNNIYDSAETKQKITQLLNGDKSDILQCSTSNKFGRLAQGNKYGLKEINTMDFMNKKNSLENA